MTTPPPEQRAADDAAGRAGDGGSTDGDTAVETAVSSSADATHDSAVASTDQSAAEAADLATPTASAVTTTVTNAMSALSTARRRLLDRALVDNLWSWLGPLAVTLLAAVLRFWALGRPNRLVFDETYYVKDAYSLLTQGYEGKWAEGADDLFRAGDFSALSSSAEYFVHPQVGKWMIAIGQWLMGPQHSYSWRFMGAICGTLAVWMIARIARRIFRSNLLGVTAGLLMAVDGNAIVLSRTGILDVFVMFFALCAFGALLLDRDQHRRRLADFVTVWALEHPGQQVTFWPLRGPDRMWPRLGIRWWRIAAGVSLGLCIGTKWSGLYFLAVFGIMTVLWDVGALRALDPDSPSVGRLLWRGTATFVRRGVPAFFATVGVALVTYIASWWSWFTNDGSYGRTWAQDNPADLTAGWPDWILAPTDALRSLAHFHTQLWDFHSNLTTTHPYMSKPWGWIIQWRPTSFFYETQGGCGSDRCSQAITSLGNPLLWWGAAIAIVAALVYWAIARDWRAGAALAGLVAGWLPWLAYSERTIYTFYSIAFEPWVVLVAVFGLGLILGSPDALRRRRRRGAIIAGVLIGLTILLSAFFWPIWSAENIPYWYWRIHMWLPSWV